MRRRKVTYPAARTATRPQRSGAAEGRPTPPTVASINTNAGAGRTDLSVGDRVRINGTGLFAGETAVIERFAGSALPSAVVRTDAGGSRQVRLVDLEPLRADG